MLWHTLLKEWNRLACSGWARPWSYLSGPLSGAVPSPADQWRMRETTCTGNDRKYIYDHDQQNAKTPYQSHPFYIPSGGHLLVKVMSLCTLMILAGVADLSLLACGPIAALANIRMICNCTCTAWLQTKTLERPLLSLKVFGVHLTTSCKRRDATPNRVKMQITWGFIPKLWLSECNIGKYSYHLVNT